MKIYIAGGYSVMNVEGREKEMSVRFDPWHRLISFYDKMIGNNIFAVIGVKNESISGDLAIRTHARECAVKEG